MSLQLWSGKAVRTKRNGQHHSIFRDSEKLLNVIEKLNMSIDLDVTLYGSDTEPGFGDTKLNKHCSQGSYVLFVGQKKASQGPGPVLVPDQNFWSGAIIQPSVPWKLKRSAIFFRGGGVGYRSALNRTMLHLENVNDANPDRKLDIRFNNGPGCGRSSNQTATWCGEHRPLSELCTYKAVVHLPGKEGASSQRLKHLFGCGSVVILPQTQQRF